MGVNDAYGTSVDGLADAGELIVDGSNADTGAVNITEFGATAGAEVYRELDPAGDGSWAVSVQISSNSGTWHSQQNDLLCSGSQDSRLRILNTSGGTADVYAVGYEVDD